MLYADLVPEFNRQTLDSIHNFYPVDGHWNPNGHRLVASIVYDYLVRLLPATVGAENRQRPTRSKES